MVKKKSIMFAEKEVTLVVVGYPSKKLDIKTFVWKEITLIKISKCTTGLLFLKKPSEKIEITTVNPETPQYLMPITYYKHEEKELFDEYVEQLKKYAAKKSLKFIDERK
jgi:hypothetical protein